MSIYRKKSAVINSQVRVNNQISQVFIPNSVAPVASINNIPIIPVNNTNTISTKYATISDISAAYSIGENWQHPISGTFANNFMGVCWSPELGIFVKHSLAYSSVSRDGLYWSKSNNIQTNQLSSICWSPELRKFCMTRKITNDYNLVVSDDGLNWTFLNPTESLSCQLSSVCWSPELRKFCAVANYGGKVLVSSDGTKWTSSNTGVYDNSWNSVCWSPALGRFCAVAGEVVGSNIQYVMISNDGITWRNAISGVLPNYWNSVCWCPELGLFCAVASSGNKNERVMISNDGLNWSNATNVVDRGWYGICWAADVGLFCATGSAGFPDCIMISRDGLTWNSANSAKSSAVYGGDFRAVCWSPELSSFCAVGVSGGDGQRVIVTRQEYRLPTTIKNYYIPLVSSNGTPEIKTKTSISYNINNNTLNLENLSTANLPTCSAVPVNSNDLINKAYLNSFVGDYTQGWIYDDWITGDASGSLNWNIDNPANASIIASDASGHIGILTLNGPITLTLSIGNVFNYSNIKSVKFIVKPFSNVYAGSGFVFIGLSIDYNAITGHSVGFYKEQGSGWFYVMNNAKITTNVYYILPLETQKKWILFEIEITNNIPTFYITIQGETGRILTCAPGYPITSTPSVKPVIRNTIGMIDVDYIDLKYSGITRA